MRFVILLGCWCLLLTHGCKSGSGDSGPSTEECQDACWRVAAADCGDIGSECFDQCIKQGTSDYGREDCHKQISDYETCFWSTGYYTCEEGQTRPADCADESGALGACLSGDGAGGDGAGGANDGGASSGGASNGGANDGGASNGDAGSGEGGSG